MTDLISIATILQTHYLAHSHLLPSIHTLLLGFCVIVVPYYIGKVFSDPWDVPVMEWQAPEVGRGSWNGSSVLTTYAAKTLVF
jgi:hypothetical protein